MKKLFYTLLVLLTFNSQAQEEAQTLFSGIGVEKVAGFGGPWLAFTELKGTSKAMLGGKFGAIFNNQIGFGVIGMGFAGGMKFRGDNLRGDTNAELKAAYGAGGIFLEYIVGLPKVIHLSFPVNVMVGGTKVEQDIITMINPPTNLNSDDDDDDIKIESNSFLVLEPGVNLELNISRNFILGGNVSYRYVSGSNLKNISDDNLSGLSFGIVVKFGNFFDPVSKDDLN